jgi:hypothetical protein
VNVVPAQAGIQVLFELPKRTQTWIPAFAGTTVLDNRHYTGFY